MLVTTLLVMFILLAFAGAATDFCTLTLPRWIPLTMLILFLVYHVEVDASFNKLFESACAGLIVSFFYILGYNYLGIGEGNINFAGACALWVGMDLLLPFLFFTGMICVVVAVILVTPVGRWQRKMVGVEPRMKFWDIPIPYGVAISLSASFLVMCRMK